ncbi:TonB-dependent receptor [uncultured Prevotella sp.]|uniref:TonB-dependent receptor n=1 Tax=uncultured Prevotella sp. TaxID=159272 RepID=UPI0025F9C766|nr:TonB-dependent receptor [uncultured Prevotella sp.]
MTKRLRLAAALIFIITTFRAYAADIKGKVTDSTTGEPLIGATIQIDGTPKATATDIDGLFAFSGLDENANYTLTIKYISYKTKKIDGVRAEAQPQVIEIKLTPDEQTLNEVTVTGVARKNTEIAVIQMTKSSPVIVSNVSAQEITKTQDTNAGEVIRRVPGVSLIDDKFVMVRGLSQRYNNVWINGGAVPSSEADSRAFSFDLIPSSQIDNMQIVKTPSPEYPADYTGGFITITTKDIPAENTAELSVGGNWNDITSFSDFKYAKGSGTDFLGFDSGMRGLNGGINSTLNSIAGNGVDLQNNHLNNDWRVRNMNPVGDLKLSGSLGRSWKLGDRQLGMIAAFNYSNEYRKYEDMQNNLFGVYDAEKDESNYLRYSVDDQYNHNVRLGAMLNFTLLSADGNSKYQLKNIFNQIGNDRYTWREGLSAQSDNENSAEYYYRSRTTYNGQITGKHTFVLDELDWSASYSYANRNVPDRRRYLINDALEPGVMQLTSPNDISREWTKLDEHIVSAAVNDKHDFKFGSFTPSLKFGAYGEYRTRKYTTRDFIYNWNAASNTLPDGFRQFDLSEMLSDESYFGADRLYLLEEQHMRNNYKGNNYLGAGYFAANIPLGNFNIYAGLRYEYDHMELITNTRDNAESPFSHNYEYNDLFPSVNTTYKINDQHQLRLSYGKTVNRPEFREVSPSVFYDFDLASNVQGNTDLKPCYIQNVDFRYEFYPSKGELISIAAFYKYFDSPIEWTYTVTGGTSLVYSYMNAQRANNYGIELDIRKDLSFIGLPGFSWSFNGALIKSRVKFEAGSKEEDRPMQGQSPYLVNTGLFYKNDKLQLDVALLYNRIGKRIIGVGRSEGTTSGNEALRVPDSYEMPRDVIDLSASKKFGNHWELKLSIRDLLAQKVYYKQFADVHYSNGTSREVEQITRAYKPGRNIGVSAVYKF